MKRKARYLVPLLILLTIISVLGYRQRGRIRMTMLDFLHSFDDVDREETFGDTNVVFPQERWCPARDGGTASDTTGQDQKQLELIRSLGYLSGYEEAPFERNVTVYDPEQASDGYNVLISGHAPGVNMIDMEGNVVHEWYIEEATVYGLWPDTRNRERAHGIAFDVWRRAYLYENGDLLTIISGGGVVKVDRESNLLWTSNYNGAHHDLDVVDDGNIYLIGRKVHINERYNPDEYISEDYLYILDSLGNTIDSMSILDLVAESPFAPTLRRSAIRNCLRRSNIEMGSDLSLLGIEDLILTGDVLHCNSVTYIRKGQLPDDYEGPLREGTVLLSLRTNDLVCAVDLEDRSIYWAESDLWHCQHEPVVLPNGNMLLFDNLGSFQASTILELNPEINEVEWLYRGDEENPFYSVGIGSCQRLPNGNTLITESLFGRAFEVTSEKEIVWEYYSPHRAGVNNELIATLYEVFRVSEDYVDGWLEDVE